MSIIYKKDYSDILGIHPGPARKSKKIIPDLVIFAVHVYIYIEGIYNCWG